MNRSPVRAAAISWIVVCGVVCGGAGTLGAAPAAAEPGAVHTGPDGPDTAGESPSKPPATGSHRHRGPRRDGRPTGAAGSGDTTAPGDPTGPAPRRPGSNRLPRAAQYPGPPAGDAETPAGPGDETTGDPDDPDYPDWPWPWPPCDGDPGNGNGGSVGSPAPGVGIARPPESAGGGGSGGGIGFPPVTVPAVPGVPSEPTPVSVGGSTAPPAAAGEPPTIEMPPVIGLPPVFEAPLRPIGTPNGSGPAEAGPAAKGAPAREPNAKAERIPVRAGSGTETPPSFRVGYPQYLRDAKIGEIAAVALPGFAGLLALTALGGFLGYRQARAGHGVRAAGTARFLR